VDVPGEDEAEPLARAELAVERDAYAALRFRDFRLLLVGRFVATLAEQMLTVALGWELYERTGSAFALGLVGLVQMIPVLLLSLPAGHLADRLNRLHIVIVSDAFLALGALALFALSATRGPLPLYYVAILLAGAAQAFNDPASSTLLPQIVPERHFANAATWSSSVFQLAAVTGPALGGVLIAVTRYSTITYALNAALGLAVVGLLLLIRSPAPPRTVSKASTAHALLEGLGFLRRTRVIVGAITLDMFAVLLGGAVTLLPIYATTILHSGATGLGLLRSAPAVGALLMAFAQAYLPPQRHAGRTLLLAVAGFGLATIVFGVSRSFALSLAMLALLGALDNISVVIRSTLLLTRVPDAMRGRVASVNSIFVGASNQLGGFESGGVAALIGPVNSVVLGGVGTVVVVGAVSLLWPELRRLGRLDGRAEGGGKKRRN
jgi:MFS family permease